MADATGETRAPLRVAFDRRLKLEFHGARITSDAGLLAYRELDDALGLTATAVSTLGEGRRGKNIRHRLLGLLRQAVYGRLAGYEDVNDAERLARDPAMRAIVSREGLDRAAASSSQMGRFETEWLATDANLGTLADLLGAWVDRVHESKPPDSIILDMDSSEPAATAATAPGMRIESDERRQTQEVRCAHDRTDSCPDCAQNARRKPQTAVGSPTGPPASSEACLRGRSVA
jgi:Transposase DDE domain group 1